MDNASFESKYLKSKYLKQFGFKSYECYFATGDFKDFMYMKYPGYKDFIVMKDMIYGVCFFANTTERIREDLDYFRIGFYPDLKKEFIQLDKKSKAIPKKLIGVDDVDLEEIKKFLKSGKMYFSKNPRNDDDNKSDLIDSARYLAKAKLNPDKKDKLHVVGSRLSEEDICEKILDSEDSSICFRRIVLKHDNLTKCKEL